MRPRALKSRNLKNNATSVAIHGNNGSPGAPGPTPARVPRMLHRTTRQSFMDIDVQYLLENDANACDPFLHASDLLSDPPSLFRQLTQPAAAGHGATLGVVGSWQGSDLVRLQKEQEELRERYLQFLHQLHATNPHAYLVHMNTFAAEAPQEFLQLQSYIKCQEEKLSAERAESQHREEMRQYQLELEKRLKQEQELKKFQEFQAMQERQRQELERQRHLANWLIYRQQQRAWMRRAPDLADLFTLSFQQDNGLMGRIASNPTGVDVVLTPQQLGEFEHYLQQQRRQGASTSLGAISTGQQPLAPTQSHFPPIVGSSYSTPAHSFGTSVGSTQHFVGATGGNRQGGQTSRPRASRRS